MPSRAKYVSGTAKAEVAYAYTDFLPLQFKFFSETIFHISFAIRAFFNISYAKDNFCMFMAVKTRLMRSCSALVAWASGHSARNSPRLRQQSSYLMKLSFLF